MVDQELFREQLELENATRTSANIKYKEEVLNKIRKGTIGDSREAILLIKASVDTVTEYVRKYYKLPLRGTRKRVRAIIMYFFKRPQDLAYIAVKAVISTLLTNGSRIKALQGAKAISRVLRDVIRAEALLLQNPSLYKRIENQHATRSRGFVNAKKIKVAKCFKFGEFTTDTILLVGLTVLDLVFKSGCNLIEMDMQRGAKVIVLTEEACDLFSKSQEVFAKMMISKKPLICEPKNWETIRGTGGYYTYDNIPFIKVKNNRDLILIMNSKPELSRLFKVINKLQKVPYRINTRVLEVVQEIMDKNLVDPNSSTSNPYLYGKIPYMETMNLFDMIPRENYGRLDENRKFIVHEDKIKWAKALDKQSRQIEAITSKRLAYRLGVNTAVEYKDREKIFYSYTADFRLRLYPVQNFLNTQSPSNLKPLLEFYNSCVLNEQGEYWLKIQGANAYGFDHDDYDLRIAEIDSRIQEIRAIREDPMGNLEYWRNADKPLLYLAFCFSYGDFLADPSIPCHIPVYLDATCSGIQIYTGLLLDYKGAMAVNVINNITGRPNDIYQDVSDEVERLILLGEYSKKITYTNKSGYLVVLDTLLEIDSIRGNMTRTLSKRNVMTTPYSVTQQGMFNQVLKLLYEMDDDNKVFWKGETWIVAKLISDLNAKAIANVVQGAIIGQRIIKRVLSRALETKNHCLWKTPFFNFPVLQRIKKEKKRQLRSPLGSLVIYDYTKEVAIRKMLNGIAPNFIHSNDVTLLLLTVEDCQEQDVTDFMLIHDDYGTLPNGIPIMNIAIRRNYVKLFSNEPLIKWTEQIAPDMVDEVRKAIIGDLDLNLVYESKYIFN